MAKWHIKIIKNKIIKNKIYQLKYIELTGEARDPPQTPPPEIRHKEMCGPAIFILANVCWDLALKSTCILTEKQY